MYLEQVVSSGTRATELVKQMLAFSRSSEIKTEQIDVVKVVSETLDMVSSTIPSSIKTSFQHADDLPDVIANPVQLNQVIMNICINARDAMGEHGHIELALNYRENFQATCFSCHQPFHGHFVELTIRDDAGGIPAEIRQSIFNPFFTTKEVGKGTGMGLAMVHGLLHGQQAHIILEVDEGVGSLFRILLPAVSSAREAAALPVKQQSIRFPQQYRIMLVDDEPSIVHLLQEVFELAGAEVLGFTDSRQALMALDDQAAGIDLLITDQTMPDVSGTELAQAALAGKPALPIILCTGYSSFVDKDSARQMGISRLLYKPVSPHDILAIAEQLLV